MPPPSSPGLLFDDTATRQDVAFFRTPYVPLLLDRKGERRALADLGDEVWPQVTPLVQITPPALRDGDEQSTPPAQWVAALARAVGDRVIYLDPAGVERRSRAAKPIGPAIVAAVLDGAAEAGMRFVPVYPVGQRPLVELVTRTSTAQRLGLAIRLRVDGLAGMGSRSIADRLAAELETLATPAATTDLVIDLAYLHPDFTIEADDVRRIIDPLLAIGPWRSLVIAASSVPATLADEVRDGQFKGILRREWGLWRSLRREYPAIRFGDYGIQSPVPPDPINTQYMRASIRYTSADWMYVARGDGPLRQMRPDEQAAQYQHLAELVFLHPAFTECCAGDRAIVDCSDGRWIVRAQQAWRAISTLHHLTTVSADLKALVARPGRRLQPAPRTAVPRASERHRERIRAGTPPARSSGFLNPE